MYKSGDYIDERYRLEQHIGSGAMGAVFKATDEESACTVAVKLLAPALVADPHFVARFQAEARALSRLNHPGIVRVFDFGRSESVCYLVMAFVAGETLQNYAVSRAPLDAAECSALVTQIAAALDHMHAAGLVHRDLKPGNIMIDDAGQLTLIDFGLVKGETVGLTRTGQTMGTFAYMAPEQFMGSRAVTAAADIYALGVIAYQLLTGRLPFTGSDAELVDAQRYRTPSGLCQYNPKLSVAGELAVLKALAKQPEQRFASAGAFAAAFSDATAQVGETLLPTMLPDTIPTPTNLPTQLTTLFGRNDDIVALHGLLQRDETRLVTLTGPGGVGKTSLALRVATDRRAAYPDGVYFVDLDPVRDPALVTAAITAPLDVREAGTHSLTEQLVTRLQEQRVLLVLDNFEHVMPSAELVTTLVRHCPHLTILVTSREPLRLRGEIVYQVTPLPVPQKDDAGMAAFNPVVQLFADHARAVNPSFQIDGNIDDIVAICTRLDGLPLAIELAASRCNILTPAQIRERLERRFRLLRRGARDAPERQRTLRAALDWSYDLLSTQEQALFRRLAVFIGGRSLEAIEAVCVSAEIDADDVLDLLASLVDKNLVRRTQDKHGIPRFMLLETMHHYALEQLVQSAESNTVADAHARYFLDLVETAKSHLRGSEQAHWLDRLDIEQDNLRTAMRHVRDLQQVTTLQRFTVALSRYWYVRGQFSEGRDWMNAVLEQRDNLEPLRVARTLNDMGGLAWGQGDFRSARTWFEEALVLMRAHDETPQRIAGTVNNLGLASVMIGDFAGAEQYYRQSLLLFRELDDTWAIADVLGNLGMISTTRGDFDTALQQQRESIALLQQIDHKPGLMVAYARIGQLSRLCGDFETAHAYMTTGLALAQELNHKPWIANHHRELGTLMCFWERFGDARRHLNEALSIGVEVESQKIIHEVLDSCIGLATALHNHTVAARLIGATNGMQGNRGDDGPLEQERAHDVALIREALGEAQFAAVRSEGAALSSAESLALARTLLTE